MEISAAEYRELIAGKKPAKPPKYRNKKVEIDGIIFDSKREAERFIELKVLEALGDITNLEIQKEFVLLEAIPGVQRKTVYRADFVYLDRDGTQVIEDAKGFRTREYRLKQKIMRTKGFEIREV